MKRIHLINEYTNGNYKVQIYEDGTKIKTTDDDEFVAEFPDSMDMKITNYCDMNCSMCHEKSTVEGKHARLDHKFLDTLRAGTELAIGGGNPLSHPELIPFLERMQKQGIICNVTVNEVHLLNNKELIQNLLDRKLIRGLGVSINKGENETIEFAVNNPNVVLHFILGTPTMDKLTLFYNKDLKILLLGYKKFGRGESYYTPEIDQRINKTALSLDEIFDAFQVVSFDNLALKQLDIKKKLPEEIYNECFMGEDGESTMYVDLVEEKFGLSSTATERYPIHDDIDSMFKFIRDNRK